MTRNATILWCILIGALTGLYAIIWANLPNVNNYMWIAFIALPLYFTCGADPKLLPQHIVCAICGVLWGVLTLALLGLGLFGGGNADLFIILLAVVGLCCVVHMVLLPGNVLGGVFSNAPMVFGGYAGIFSQGPGEAVGVVATLVGGGAACRRADQSRRGHDCEIHRSRGSGGTRCGTRRVARGGRCR